MPLPKPDQRVNYAERIERVVSYIESSPPSDVPDLDTLASVAALSAHHFHRIYRLMTGETVNDTVARVRLSRGVAALDGSILKATAAAGYATSQAFARSVKAKTGLTPSQIQASADLQGKVSEAMKSSTDTTAPLRVEVVSTEPLRLTALRNVGAYPELNAVYERLFSLVFADLPMEALQGIYGFRHDDPRCVPPEACRAEAALDVGGAAALSEDLYHIDIPSGSWARIRHIGDYDAIETYVDVLYAWLVEAGYPLDDRPVLYHFLDDPEQVAASDLRADIHLPLAGG